jgi:SAM-dependent methyltransferase
MKPVDCEALYRDGRHYDLGNRGQVADIPFYLKQIRKYGGPVLELACGTGRITIPIAEKGVQITGLDVSASMLAHARRKARAQGLKIKWVEADCRDFRLDERFGLIFFPFNSIAHLHDLESVESCFSCVKEHLRTEGRFIIDVFQPDLHILTRDPEQRYPVTEYPDPDGKGIVVITENNLYDSATQVNRIKWYYGLRGQEGEKVELLNMRIFYPQELDGLLHYSGFVIEEKFGDYDGSPLTSEAPKQIVVSGLAGRPGS